MCYPTPILRTLISIQWSTSNSALPGGDANGVVTLDDYDALGRLTQVSYPANAALNASYTCDGTVYSYGIGRLSTISDNTGSMALLHIGPGVGKYIAIQGVTYLINYGYDTAGNLVFSNSTFCTAVRNRLVHIYPKDIGKVSPCQAASFSCSGCCQLNIQLCGNQLFMINITQ